MKMPGILLISLFLSVTAGQLPDILLAENAGRTIPIYGQLVPDDIEELEEDEPEDNRLEESDKKESERSDEEEEMEKFTKIPLDKELYPGEETEYLLQGFGNGSGRIMQRYSLTDIFPEGLHFVKAELPAFTGGTGITYTITYITNQNGRRILQEEIPAEQPFVCESPELAKGEWIMYLTIKIPEVPDGFGIGDEIRITCKVDEDPPETELINRAKIGFDGMDESTEGQGLMFADSESGTEGGQPGTGDTRNIWLWTGMAGISAAMILLIYIWMKRKRPGEERQQ